MLWTNAVDKCCKKTPAACVRRGRTADVQPSSFMVHCKHCFDTRVFAINQRPQLQQQQQGNGINLLVPVVQ